MGQGLPAAWLRPNWAGQATAGAPESYGGSILVIVLNAHGITKLDRSAELPLPVIA